MAVLLTLVKTGSNAQDAAVIVKRMSDYMAAQKNFSFNFSFRFNSSLEVVAPQSQIIQFDSA
jgi:hypothetical protein